MKSTSALKLFVIAASVISMLLPGCSKDRNDSSSLLMLALPSDNAGLSNLTISPGVLNETFSSGRLAYTATVANEVSEVSVTPTTDHQKATVTVNGTSCASGAACGPVSLSVGSTVITVRVTAQDGTATRIYTITIWRVSNDACLSVLAVSAGSFNETFSPDTRDYTLTVANSTSATTVTPTARHGAATITVNGVPVASGGTSGSLSLAVGANTITVVVTAEDAVTKNTYSIIVTRNPSSNADLSGLTMSSGTFNETFSAAQLSYTATVTNDVSQVTVRPTTAHAAATVMVNGATVASGSASAPIDLVVGANTVTVAVMAQDTTTVKEYVITVTRTPNSNANLSGLSVSGATLSPVFSSNTTGYSCSVANAVTSITVTPTAVNAYATMTVNGTPCTSGAESGPITLSVGNNTITVRVTAQNGTTIKTYTITARRISNDANLSGLVISAGSFNEVFNTDNESYTATVANTSSSTTVRPTARYASATIKVNGVTVSSGWSSGSIALIVGTNTITVVVTAEDTVTKKTYTVTVTRNPSSNANLSGLTISRGQLNPVFSAGTTAYTAQLGYSVTQITVTPVASHSLATVTVNGSTVVSGSASGPLSLAIGDNVITVVVTAEDTVTKKTYVITAQRAAVPSSNANLSGLTTNRGSLTPAFDANTLSYSITVANSSSTMTVTPTTADSYASLKVNGTTVASGTASAPVALVVGDNSIPVVVTAEDGTTTKTYTIHVKRLCATHTYNGNYTISTSTDLANLSGYTSINGSLLVQNTSLTNLNGLECLTSISYSLIIDNNDNMTNIDGLKNLQTVGSITISENPLLPNLNALINVNSAVRDIVIDRNNSLTSIAGLSNIQSVNHYLQIDSNNSLATLEGLDSIDAIAENPASEKGALIIMSNPALTTLSHLNGITSIRGELRIEDNNSLTAFDGLSGLTSVDGQVWIEFNNNLADLDGLHNLNWVGSLYLESNFALASISGLSNLTSVEDMLYITENTSLSNLHGLGSLVSIGQILEIRDNSAMTSLEGLESLESIGLHLTIFRNNLLTNLDPLSGLTYLGGTLDIYQNDVLTDITGLSGLSAVGSSGNGGSIEILNNNSLLTLDGLENITAVGNQSAGGSVEIDNNPLLSDLSGLSGISSLPGFLVIRRSPSLSGLGAFVNLTSIGSECTIQETALTDLSGFENLAQIGGSLRIWANSGLTSLSGLGGLTAIGGDLFISTNPELLNLNGLSSLDTIDGNLKIEGNAKLVDLTGLSGVTSFAANLAGYGDVYIVNNDALPTLSGLGWIMVTNWLWISDNDALIDVNGINNVVYAEYLYIRDNTLLQNIDSLSKLTTVGQTVDIWNNPGLSGIAGLNNITYIGSALTISNNDSLNSISGLNKLTQVDNLSIDGNDSLTDISGLTKLGTLDGSLSISSNTKLTNISGLNILRTVRYSFFIRNNPLLPVSVAQTMLNRLYGFTGTSDITGNLE